ncbi:MAG: hypothetical protein ABIJ59_16365 [Pseudomonadota bacterium]
MDQNKKDRNKKKPENTLIDPDILTGLTPFIKNNKIECLLAHKVARQLDTAPIEIGRQLDLQGCKIVQCQLGLFGYGKHKKNFNPDIIISFALEKRILAEQTDKTISCFKCWQLAKEQSISRLDIGSACDKKGLRIKPCQLGVF